MKRIEALADAIIACTNYADPSSEEYQCRNPLSLKGFSVKQEKNESGIRKFATLLGGYHAALFDLQIKCNGDSRAKVSRDSTIKELIRCYSMSNPTADYVVAFLHKALGDSNISADTPLHYFVTENGDAG